MKAVMLALALCVVSAAPAAAAPQDLANEIAAEVMSPFCEGVTLHDCSSQAAADLRSQIEQWAQDGWSKTRIMAELEERYGSSIHATPQDATGAPAWVVPVLVTVIGLGGIVLLASRWTRRPRVDEPSIDPTEHARVERELAALREELS